MTCTNLTLLEELAAIDVAISEGTATPAQQSRRQQLIILADAAPELLTVLKDMLYRFHSCIADGNGEIEGDKEAMMEARAIIAKTK